MPRLFFVCCLALFIVAPDVVYSAEPYVVHYDLHFVIRDKLFVNVQVPAVVRKSFTDSNSACSYVFPVIAPGTYEYSPWWKLVSDFTAFDVEGKPLPVGCGIDSQFVILGAERLHSISYWLDDSFDVSDGSIEIFHPAGVGFEDSIAVINHTGIVGYVDGFQSLPYEVHVDRPSHLYCATALDVISRTDTSDIYIAPNYDALVDGPVLYSRPDTATFDVHGTQILVAMAHHSKNMVAPAYAKSLKKVTESIASFLGTMPVKKYAFLFYLWNGDTNNVKYMHYAIGALEHNLSSMYFWRYSKTPFGLNDIAAHEFLHILVPLNLHSREIDQFNFRQPSLSEHIWLYEGATEYFADQSLLRGKILPEKGFVEKIRSWIASSDELPDSFSLTEFSKNILTRENQRVYSQIYEYGPLNALLLDITLRSSSDKEVGLLELVQRLMKEYGPTKPFEDEKLFSEIGRVSTPEAERYCTQHISNSKRIPYRELLSEIGLKYTDSIQTTTWSFGVSVDLDSNDTEIRIKPDTEAPAKNPLGAQAGDLLLSVNGKSVSVTEFDDALTFLFSPFTGDEITIVVKRAGNEVTLTGEPTRINKTKRHLLDIDTQASAEQVALRNSVFFGKKL